MIVHGKRQHAIVDGHFTHLIERLRERQYGASCGVDQFADGAGGFVAVIAGDDEKGTGLIGPHGHLHPLGQLSGSVFVEGKGLPEGIVQRCFGGDGRGQWVDGFRPEEGWPGMGFPPPFFSGDVDGLFRFKADGSNERGLAIMRVGSAGAQVAAAAPRSFGV